LQPVILFAFYIVQNIKKTIIVFVTIIENVILYGFFIKKTLKSLIF